MTAAGESACLFGSDVGGTKIHSVVTAMDGTILAETRAPTPAGDGLAALDRVAAHLAELGAGRRVVAAGIGLPGAVRPDSGHVHRAGNLPGLEGRDMRAALSARLGLPVAVENDVNLAALGESWLGHGRDGAVRDAVRDGGLAFLSLGTGIGMGLVYGDRILRGARGVAGEIAWLPVGADPFDPAVQECGALESLVSGAALVRDYRRRGGRRTGSFRDLSRDAGDDPALAATLDLLAERVALAVLAIESVVDPALYVFGGGIGSRPDVLPRVLRALDRLGGGARDCRISLLGNRAGVLGATRAAALTPDRG